MRIGVFGGTFNPIHNGHLALARGCADSFSLDSVLVIPALIPPHKVTEELPSPDHRLELCRLAFIDDNRFIISDMEIARGGVSYTVDTLGEIKRQHPEDDLFLIMGGDMFLTLSNWRNPQKIFNLASIVTCPREYGELASLQKKARELSMMGASAFVCEQLPLPLSSTEIREGNAPIDKSIPPVCLDYIKQNGLYGYKESDYPWPYERYISEAHQMLSAKRLHHSMMVAEEAKKLASHYGEEPNTAYVAGIVHDLCKESSSAHLLQILAKSDIIYGSAFKKTPKVWHGFAAAGYIKWELSIHNARIINAVRYHSTGRADMQSLEKIIYLADLISEDREYHGVEEMRQISYESLDQAMLKALSFQITDLVSKGSPVYDETFNAYNFFAEVLA